MKYSIFIMGLAIVLAVSCKKKENDTPTDTAAKSKTELLTAHHWKLNALTVDPPRSGVTDMYAQMQACDKDDVVRYYPNGTTANDEGPSKCDPADPQETPGTWSFKASETILTEDGEDVNILNLTENELKVSYVTQINSIDYTLTATFIKN